MAIDNKKKSFFERLTGAVNVEHLDIEHEEEENENEVALQEEDPGVGELAVDVHQTPDIIVIKAFVAGVRPEDLDVAITRDSVTIRGRRTEDNMNTDDSYHIRELYWGEFVRIIPLPAEIDPEEAEAQERHGLLIIKLPKINRDRQTRVRVKAI